MKKTTKCEQTEKRGTPVHGIASANIARTKRFMKSGSYHALYGHFLRDGLGLVWAQGAIAAPLVHRKSQRIQLQQSKGKTVVGRCRSSPRRKEKKKGPNSKSRDHDTSALSCHHHHVFIPSTTSISNYTHRTQFVHPVIRNVYETSTRVYDHLG